MNHESCLQLSDEFRRQQNELAQECKVAFMKIQSWNFVCKTPEIGESYTKQAAEMIKAAFFNFGKVPIEFYPN